MLLSVEKLQISFGSFTPVRDVTVSVNRGEILGLVGESGSGKSITATAIMGLLDYVGGRVSGGRVLFEGVNLTGLPEEQMRRLRGKRIGLITQNPMTSLDPMITVGKQIEQAARLHLRLNGKAAYKRTLDLMKDVRIPDPQRVHRLYPHQLSGGMKQRIVIAMALAGEPDLLIADEPTTALDATVQAQIIRNLVELVKLRGLAMILITHDMGVVAQTCDQVAVMYCGRIVERSSVQTIFATARHPYTEALIRCIPNSDMQAGTLIGIPGVVPSAVALPSGCSFHPRCSKAQSICHERVPEFRQGEHHAGVACHLGELA
ncbi:ABC transporter [Ensifer sp. Root31]|uniref:ABC transporter ATP-binding protein n=1 Tax=Ensifer sp. Root31 TaxID=1736512 RepID=UPI00070B45C4|nr:ABC transporter ATP-binding protein [Ensifer sp. Root31]KQU86326.1 ABC transporter [Ensifer sp. Root31]